MYVLHAGQLCVSDSAQPEPSLEHGVLCPALCVSDSAQPAELPQ